MKNIKENLLVLRSNATLIEDLIHLLKYDIDTLIDHIADLEDKMKEREVQNDNRSI